MLNKPSSQESQFDKNLRNEPIQIQIMLNLNEVQNMPRHPIMQI